MEPEAAYRQRIAETEVELRHVKARILRVSSLRVLLFVAGVIGLILFFKAGWWAVCAVVLFTFVPFLALVKYHNRLFYRKDWLETCLRVNRDELRFSYKLRPGIAQNMNACFLMKRMGLAVD